ncbi:MAG TPA: hypothetical protein VGJ38_15825 [Jatrophihabitantaceae bacterium]|jgi:hypothetical protein
MQPPRGKWTELARGLVAWTLIGTLLVDAPRGFFDLYYPTWLRWIDYTLGMMFLATLATYVVLRARELISYRRAQTGH